MKPMALDAALKSRLAKAQLYLVTGQELSKGRPTPKVAEEALKGGVDILQMREYSLNDSELLKTGQKLRELTRKYNALFIVNNRPDIARLLDADGVHIGQDDLPIAEARKIIGTGKMVGVSTHAVDQMRKAIAEGADYIGVGPIFATPTKSGRKAVTIEYVRKVASMDPPVPFFAVGGINFSTLPEVLEAGAWRVAIVRAIMGAEDPEETAGRFKKILEKYPLSAIQED
jgi:thiamine-phosphate pyrophosphorylase